MGWIQNRWVVIMIILILVVLAMLTLVILFSKTHHETYTNAWFLWFGVWKGW